jgi:uncharacterized RDD family membrane protein YckC
MTAPSLTVRALSMLYESVLLFGVVVGAGFLWLPTLNWTYPLSRPQAAATFAMQVAVIGLYFVWQWKRGGTLPMQTWKLRLSRVDGSPLTLGRAVARYLLAWILFVPAIVPLVTLQPGPGVSLFLLGVSPFAMLLTARFDSERQMPYDRWLGLRLMRAAPAAARSAR